MTSDLEQALKQFLEAANRNQEQANDRAKGEKLIAKYFKVDSFSGDPTNWDEWSFKV